MAASDLFDVGIVGYGPAGITAAIYSARKKLSTVLIGLEPGGEVLNSGPIENWPGGGQTDGIALSESLVKHLDLYKNDVTVIENKVTRITQDDDSFFTLTLENGETRRSKTVIYTAGRHPRLLNVPGEKEFKNKGVTYCATCDAPLFAGQDVAVVGGGNSGAEAVIMLQKIATKIYFLHLEEALRADAVLVDNFRNDPKVQILLQAKTTRIEGEGMVKKLVYTDQATGTDTILEVGGIFIHIGAIPNTEPIKDLLELDTFGAIPADRYGVTSLPGFFAAGDVTTIRDAQIVVAAGQGCSAALSAGDYLARQTFS